MLILMVVLCSFFSMNVQTHDIYSIQQLEKMLKEESLKQERRRKIRQHSPQLSGSSSSSGSMSGEVSDFDFGTAGYFA